MNLKDVSREKSLCDGSNLTEISLSDTNVEDKVKHKSD